MIGERARRGRPQPAARPGGARRLAALALLLSAASTAPLAATEKVIVTYRQEVTSADLLIALEEGYFEELGLEIEALPWNGGLESLPLLAQGKIDFMPTGVFATSYVNLIQRGGRVRLVAARTMHTTGRCDYRSFVARSELLESGRLRDLAAINGLRVSASRTQGDFYYWARLLEEAGLGFDDITLHLVASAGMPVAMGRGLVDLAIQGEPSLSRTLASGEARVWMPVSRVVPDAQNSFLLFGPNLLDRRPEVGRRVVAALQKAVTQYLDPARYERNVEILARRTKMPPEEVRRMCWPGWSPDGVIDRAGLQEFLRWARREGLVDTLLSFEALVDERFLAAAGRTPSPQPAPERP